MNFFWPFFDSLLCLKKEKTINQNRKAQKDNFSPLEDLQTHLKYGSVFRRDWGGETT